MKPRIVVVAALLIAAVAPARAAHHDPATVLLNELHFACARANTTCTQGDEGITTAFASMERAGGGVSYDDERDTFESPFVDVEVGSYYFSPRVLQVNPGQIVRFINVSPAGGNRHIVASSDWMSLNHAALPVPGSLSFGGGSFASGLLQPGDSWTWEMPQLGQPSEHPESGVHMGIDKVLVPYHCNLHGAGVMNGYLILSTTNY